MNSDRQLDEKVIEAQQIAKEAGAIEYQVGSHISESGAIVLLSAIVARLAKLVLWLLVMSKKED